MSASVKNGEKVCISIRVVPCKETGQSCSGKKNSTVRSKSPAQPKKKMHSGKTYDELMADAQEYDEIISGVPTSSHPMTAPLFDNQTQFLTKYLMPQSTTMKHSPKANMKRGGNCGC
jgi:hypothetical protein